MTKPAARITDPVIHLLPPVLTPAPGSNTGSPNVLIGNLPAWRGISAQQLALSEEETPREIRPVKFHGGDTSYLNHLKVDATRKFVYPRLDLSGVQTKLTVGAPGDKYEQEADAMASQVMSMPDSAVQREVAPEETDEEVQTKPLAAGITPLVQRETMPEEEEVQTKPLGNGTIQREEMPEEEIQTKSISASIQRVHDPDAQVSHKPKPGFGILSYDPVDDRLSTASSPANLPIDSKGYHQDHNKRYQVISVSII